MIAGAWRRRSTGFQSPRRAPSRSTSTVSMLSQSQSSTSSLSSGTSSPTPGTKHTMVPGDKPSSVHSLCVIVDDLHLLETSFVYLRVDLNRYKRSVASDFLHTYSQIHGCCAVAHQFTCKYSWFWHMSVGFCSVSRPSAVQS